MSFNILFVGQMVPGARTYQRVNALQTLGHRVDLVPTNSPGSSYEDKPSFLKRLRHRLRCPEDVALAGPTILKKLREKHFDYLWCERAVEIGPRILREAKNITPSMQIIWYAEDDMMNPHHRSRQVEAAMPFYDLWVTTKSFNMDINEVPRFGVKNMFFVNNSYDEKIHKPTKLNEQDRTNFGAEISFVGTYEKNRADSLIYLAKNGCGVRVWGNGWSRLSKKAANLTIEDRPIYDVEYAKVICSSKINLCFLRKENRDLQTCRSIEIPACGGFMLHERNSEMLALFTEDIEAGYFDSDQELLEQCKKWMSNDVEREAIAKGGFNRVTTNSFSHQQRLQEILQRSEKNKSL